MSGELGEHQSVVGYDCQNLLAVRLTLGCTLQIKKPSLPRRDLYPLVAKTRRPLSNSAEAVKRGIGTGKLGQKYRWTFHGSHHSLAARFLCGKPLTRLSPSLGRSWMTTNCRGE